MDSLVQLATTVISQSFHQHLSRPAPSSTALQRTLSLVLAKYSTGTLLALVLHLRAPAPSPGYDGIEAQPLRGAGRVVVAVLLLVGEVLASAAQTSLQPISASLVDVSFLPLSH